MAAEPYAAPGERCSVAAARHGLLLFNTRPDHAVSVEVGKQKYRLAHLNAVIAVVF